VTGNLHEVDPAFEAGPFANGYPKGAELVAFVWARAFGPRFIEMLNLIYAPLGFLGIALLCQLFGAGWQDSLVFGACYLLVPANRIHGQVAQPIGRRDLVPVFSSGDATDMRRSSSVAGLPIYIMGQG
jgi:hypothetical protein